MTETTTLPKTLGESRVRIKFNPSNVNLVDHIKQKSAELIDIMEQFKDDSKAKGINDGELYRLIALAQTDYESAAGWAVKATTFGL